MIKAVGKDLREAKWFWETATDPIKSEFLAASLRVKYDQSNLIEVLFFNSANRVIHFISRLDEFEWFDEEGNQLYPSPDYGYDELARVMNRMSRV